MQYIKLRYQTDEVDLFSDEDMDGNIQPISRKDYERLLAYLQKKNPAAILPIQIAYYAGLRIGEACGLAWQDVNLEEQCLTIRRSIRYDGSKRKYIIGPTTVSYTHLDVYKRQMFMLESLMTILLIHSWKKQSVIAIMRN